MKTADGTTSLLPCIRTAFCVSGIRQRIDNVSHYVRLGNEKIPPGSACGKARADPGGILLSVSEQAGGLRKTLLKLVIEIPVRVIGDAVKGLQQEEVDLLIEFRIL